MRLNPRARLDASQVSDRRGGGGTVAVGGGVGGLLLLLVALLTGTDPSALVGGGEPGAPVAGAGTLGEQCQVAADVERVDACRHVVVVNSIQSFWSDLFARSGEHYRPAVTNIFSGQVSTGCGTASAAVGPFYCPADEGVYLDLGFFDELTTTLGAVGGDFAEAYVLAHEYGHHVSNLTGRLGQVQGGSGPQSQPVRLELQADCFAGMWARAATRTPGPDGQPLITELTAADIQEGLDAAGRVGDDYIQSRVRGMVTPETWTHGSSEQRRSWFLVGFERGSFQACDTFAAPRV